MALGVLLALLLWDQSGADLAVAQWFGTASGFAWHHHWLPAQLLHNGGRWLSFAVLMAVAVNVVRPLAFARGMSRHARLWWFLATLGCLLVIPLAKGRSMVSCPWDLAQFGGAARYLPHWTLQAWAGAGDGGAGHCFPSGHASAAFSFVTGWFVLRQLPGTAARRWLIGVGVLGLVFGLSQVARGAHYPSHVAWTAWICWVFSATSWHAAHVLRRGPNLTDLRCNSAWFEPNGVALQHSVHHGPHSSDSPPM